MEDKVVYIYKYSGKNNLYTSNKLRESKELASILDLDDYIINCANEEIEFTPWGKTIMLLEGIYNLKDNGCSFSYVRA